MELSPPHLITLTRLHKAVALRAVQIPQIGCRPAAVQILLSYGEFPTGNFGAVQILLSKWLPFGQPKSPYYGDFGGFHPIILH